MTTFLFISVIMLLLINVCTIIEIIDFKKFKLRVNSRFDSNNCLIKDTRDTGEKNLEYLNKEIKSLKNYLNAKIILISKKPSLYNFKSPEKGEVYEMEIQCNDSINRNLLITLLDSKLYEKLYEKSYKSVCKKSNKFVCLDLETNEFCTEVFDEYDLNNYCKTEITELKKQLEQCKSKSKKKR